VRPYTAVDTGGATPNDASEVDVGKLPNELLARLLARIQRRDPRVLLGPGIGRDAAVIDAGGERLLVAKSDPVTFASDHIGWYAVHVNANDVACMGARPAWFLATVLLPQGASEEQAGQVFGQVLEACQGLEVELVGGHTEITYGLERPIVVGAMLGEVEREALVQHSGAREGDAVILSKGIAIEGTAVLAREGGERLERLGVPGPVIQRARGYIFEPGISVVREALTACEALRGAGGSVHAMHDPTEGGLATALYELAEASGLGVAVQEREITVLPETRAICAAASLEALGLLASGALLITVTEEDCGRALSALGETGIEARRIGGMVRRETGVIIEGRAGTAPVPHFARDEVARFLAG
jgi:hydrogenase expression/formation protein HypE